MPWQIKSTRYKCSGICLGHISTQELHPQHSAFSYLKQTYLHLYSGIIKLKFELNVYKHLVLFVFYIKQNSNVLNYQH